MKKYLFDTNIFIYAFSEQTKAIKLMQQALENKGLFLSAIVYAEIYISPELQYRKKIEALLPFLKFIPVTEEIACLGGQLRYQAFQKKKRKYLDDCFIAATAITNDLTLVTNNIKDYQFEKDKPKILQFKF